MDFIGIQKSKKKDSGIKNCVACVNEKSMPQMSQQAFSSRGSCEEYCKASRDSQNLKFEAASRIMNELCPQRTGRGSNPTAEHNIVATFDKSCIGRSAHTTLLGNECTAQLTIFYNGTVNVYHVFEKQAEAIINLAGNEIRFQQLHSADFDHNQTLEPFPALNPLKNSASQRLHNQNLDTGINNPQNFELVVNSYLSERSADLPLQRKQSLLRFLQNRKEYRYIFLGYYCYRYLQQWRLEYINVVLDLMGSWVVQSQNE